MLHAARDHMDRKVVPTARSISASLAGSYVGRIREGEPGGATVLTPPTAARAHDGVVPREPRLGSASGTRDSSCDTTATSEGVEAAGPNNPMAYAVFVESDADVVWVTDWGANGLRALTRRTETFTVRAPIPRQTGTCASSWSTRPMLGCDVRSGQACRCAPGRLIRLRTEVLEKTERRDRPSGRTSPCWRQRKALRARRAPSL